MNELIHILNHCTGLCGENHPNIVSFALGINETGPMLQYLTFKFKPFKSRINGKMGNSKGV